MQTLPSTAAEMASKLGISFDPSRMTSHAPADIAYQRQLGNAYLREGLQKTGNIRDALRYYHGGPNRALWGPKTNAYAASILERLR
jgi:soluble lytic murein transglycosylase-like protein